MISKARKNKRKANIFVVILSVLLVAVLLVALTIFIFYKAGYRYFKVRVSDDLYVKFIGKIDENGAPLRGRLRYSNGLSADVNLDREEVSYNNGDIYSGTLDNLLKNGYGVMRFANGDVYEGEYVHDKMTGEGKKS